MQTPISRELIPMTTSGGDIPLQPGKTRNPKPRRHPNPSRTTLGQSGRALYVISAHDRGGECGAYPGHADGGYDLVYGNARVAVAQDELSITKEQCQH